MEVVPSGNEVVGRLLPSHSIFRAGDASCQMLQRLGVYDVDSEELCHPVIKTFQCYDPGCVVEFNSVMEYDMHYSAVHRYSCATCKKNLASPHLLDLHIEEAHDSFFAVQAERKPMYRCFVESCVTRFLTCRERHSHCIEEHAFPSNFRWITSETSKAKSKKKKVSSATNRNIAEDQQMEHDSLCTDVKTSDSAKQIRGIVFGRGNKKSFTSNCFKNWHKMHGKAPRKGKSILEGSELSCDLMDSLPIEPSSS